MSSIQEKQQNTNRQTPQSNKSVLQSNALSNKQSVISIQDLKSKHAIKPIIYNLFKLLSFVIQFNYSVQNAVITMLMISFATPNIIDSLIWTVPNIVAILIRPYVVRYVHSVHKAHRMRNEAFLLNGFLFLNAVGAFIVAQSCLMNQSKKGVYLFRILVCSIGWTLTGLSSQLCEFFLDKFKESLQNQCYIKNSVLALTKNEESKSSKNQNVQQIILINFESQLKPSSLFKNYSFLGSFSGYFLVLLVFTFQFSGEKMKTFFQQCNIAYTIWGFMTFFCAIACYFMISYSGIPRPDPQSKPKSAPFKISFSLNYYLPGLSELKYMSIRGLSFLGIHFIINFVMDVMFIYTTMWTAGSAETTGMKQGEANFRGIKHGVFYLIVYTFVYYGDLIPLFFNKKTNHFKLLLLKCVLLFFISFWFNYSILFLPLMVFLAAFYRTYEQQIEPMLEQIQPQIKISKQIIVRIQKIAVLNVLPFITMIILDRDDIQDCLVWSGILLLIVGILLVYNDYEGSPPINRIKDQYQKEKSKKQ